MDEIMDKNEINGDLFSLIKSEYLYQFLQVLLQNKAKNCT